MHDETVKHVEAERKVLLLKLKKILKNKLLLCVVILGVLITIYSLFLGWRSERYTHNLQNYEAFFKTKRQSHYEETIGDFTVTMWNVFTIREPRAEVELRTDFVYWEEADDYIYIGLFIKEDLWGNQLCQINFQSEQYTWYDCKSKGRFLIDENMNPISEDAEEYKDFVYQNEEVLTRMAERANYYWNLDLAYNPD